MVRRPLSPPLVLALLLLTAPLACGGGGGGGGGPTQPPAPSITFSADAPSPPANSVSLQRASSSQGSTLALDVVATDVEDLYGVAFDLLYTATAHDYVRVEEGSFLSSDGMQTTLQLADAGSGRLIVGLTRRGESDGISRSGVLMTVTFQAAGNGGGSLAFDQQRAVNRRGATIPGVTWPGGSVTVQR